MLVFGGSLTGPARGAFAGSGIPLQKTLPPEASEIAIQGTSIQAGRQLFPN